MESLCNRDCFNCPFPDCIIDEISDSEIEKSEKADESVRICRHSHNPNLEARRIYCKSHRPQCSKTTREWRHNNAEHCRQYAKQYYQKNRERILENAKKYRNKKRDKERQQWENQ